MADDENQAEIKFIDVSPSPKKSIRPRLLLATVGAVLGSFQFGYNSGVINSPEANIKDFINETDYERSGDSVSEEKLTNIFAVIVAVFAVGGCIGGFGAGWWADKFGRKRGLLLNTIFGIAAAVLMYFGRMAKTYEMIIVGRLVVGINSGLYTGLTPLYLSEISTPRIRGALGVLHQLGVVIGLLTSQILSFPELLGNDKHWEILLGLAVVPCLLQILFLPLAPESPRYLLITKKEMTSAVEALTILHGPDIVEEKIDEMQQEAAAQGKEEKVNILSLFLTPSLRRPLIISIVMHLSQQLSGITGIFYYSSSLFKGAGLNEDTATHATSGVGAIMVTMTIITIPLMDGAGRRTLHLIGLSGMFVASIFITVTLALRHTVSFMNILSVVVSLIYVMFFALGPGSIPWLIVAELFCQGPRTAATSVAVLVNWMATILVGFTFPHLQNVLGDYTFVPFSVFLLLFAIFTFFFVPETKNKTFEEVSRIWKGNDNSSSQTARDSAEKPRSHNEQTALFNPSTAEV